MIVEIHADFTSIACVKFSWFYRSFGIKPTELRIEAGEPFFLLDAFRCFTFFLLPIRGCKREYSRRQLLFTGSMQEKQRKKFGPFFIFVKIYFVKILSSLLLFLFSSNSMRKIEIVSVRFERIQFEHF